jgi:hypothetical protein
MASDQETYLRDFYGALRDEPLEPGDHKYIHLYEDAELTAADPIKALATTIEWSGESKQLFSGFRGTGKSTELRRLRKMLQAQGNTKVVLCDLERYVNLTTPIDISDFLISAAGAFSDALEDDELLGKEMIKEDYWTRIRNFLTRTEVGLPERSANAKVDEDIGVGLKISLKADPSFRQKVQKQMAGHLGALTNDVNAFMEDCIKALHRRHGDDVRVVVLFDSVERIRGTSLNADDVASSVETLFEGHSDKLGFPYMHVVYTVPPWLKIKSPGVASLYDNSQQIPCVKVRNRDGTPCRAGLDALERLIRKRGDWERLLGDRVSLDALCLASGGYLRDLFRLLQALLRQARGRELPTDAATRELIMDEIRNSYLPISNQDALWLDRIRQSGTTQLEDGRRLHELARFFDTHLVLTYRNGEEWWFVHPLLEKHIEEQASAYRAGSAPAE